MKVISFLFFLMIPFLSFSKTFTSKIHHIDESSDGSPHLIMLIEGDVIFLSDNKNEYLDSLKRSKELNRSLKIQTDDQNNFISVGSLKVNTDNSDAFLNKEDHLDVNSSYEPTILNSYNDATQIFRRMRRDYQTNSQCYNRAHIWTWEEYNRSQLRSKKYFLFFTARYIRAYRYHWWFHVTPAVSINGLGDRMLDRRYTVEIKSIKDWTDKFIYSKRSCPIVFKYNDYRNNQYAEHCYLIPVSMYFWQPRDIERRDRLGTEKRSFIKSEVNYAYWEAF
jgi:hypothetical protein